ncbi:MAG: hypothetical protein Q9202_000148 [Teloschistes flavicans]
MVDKPCAIGNNHALTNPSADPSVPHDHGSSDDKDISHTLEDRETGMDRVISRITSRSSYPDPGPPPDGGLQAWTQAVMGHLVVFNTWGYIISFGVFQSYYVTTLNHPPSDVSWFIAWLTEVVLATYFSGKRALAIGIGASGSATGGIVFPVIVQQLLPKIGFAWTVRVLGFVMLGIQCIVIVFIRPRVPPRKSGPLVEWAAFRELPYILFSIGMFLSFWGLYFAFYYVGTFGRNIIGISQEQSINNLLILNGPSTQVED